MILGVLLKIASLDLKSALSNKIEVKLEKFLIKNFAHNEDLSHKEQKRK